MAVHELYTNFYGGSTLLNGVLTEENDTIVFETSDALRYLVKGSADVLVSFDPNSVISEKFLIENSNTFTLTRTLSSKITSQFTFPLTYDYEEQEYVDDTGMVVEQTPVIGYIRSYPIIPEVISQNGSSYEITFKSTFEQDYQGYDLTVSYKPEPIFEEIHAGFSGTEYFDPAPTAMKFINRQASTSYVWIRS